MLIPLDKRLRFSAYHSVPEQIVFRVQVTLNPEWQVPAGDESSERAEQDGRMRGTLEAIYLHGSAIPNRWAAVTSRSKFFDSSFFRSKFSYSRFFRS